MSYDKYQAEFMRLSHHVYGLTHTYKMNCFISGLRDVVTYEVMAKNTATMVAVMRLAKLEGEKSNVLNKSSKGNVYKGFLGGTGGTQSGVGAPQKAITAGTTATPVHHLRN